VRFSRRTKYAVLGVGVLGSLLMGAQTLAEVYPPRLLSGELYSWVWYHRFGVGGWFLLAILAFEIFVSKRFWCRYACPGGALYVLLSHWRLLRLKVARDACDACRDCEPVCEFGLKPEAKDVGPECNACGECLPVCHSSALDLSAGKVHV
jgi:ferredoxin-type protein NapH